MELAKSFDPHEVETALVSRLGIARLLRAFRGTEKRPYCIQLPPPNVTGTLHMGHAFQQTLMDALIRYHRMRGFDTNWVVGTDHAGIATQIVVERQLESKARAAATSAARRSSKRVWDWKQQSGSTITRQMRRLGASANWSFADSEGQNAGYFTMDERMSRAVVEVFVRLHEQGLIYRGKRLVNWDPVLRHRRVGPGGGQRGRGRQDLGDPLSARARQRLARRRHNPARNHARRRSGRRESEGRALHRVRRQAACSCRSPADRSR